MDAARARMTRDDRIVAIAREGEYGTLTDLGQRFGLSRERVSQILRHRGVKVTHGNAAKRLEMPKSLRKTFVGELAADTAEALAIDIRRRFFTKQCSRIFVFVEKGRVYAPTRDCEPVQDMIRDFPELFVGCYAKGFEIGDLVEDLQAVRGGVA